MKKKGSECKKVFFVNPVNLFFKKFEIFQTISACKCFRVKRRVSSEARNESRNEFIK